MQSLALKAIGSVHGPRLAGGSKVLGTGIASQEPVISIHPQAPRCADLPVAILTRLSLCLILPERERKKELRNREVEWIFGAQKRRDKKMPCLADMVF